MAKTLDVPVYGHTEPGFEKVRDTFTHNFHHRNDTGASCCVYYRGKKAVDIWGGWKDRNKHIPWEADTLSIVFSTTKGVSSLAFSLLHSKGLLDYDEKVSTYWEAFAANGKEHITVRQLLAHQAGLFSNDKSLTYEVLTDADQLSNCLAKQKPYWIPGEKRGYHAWTIGLYMNEILKRIDPRQRNISQFLQEELISPLNTEFYIGLPEHIDASRLAELIPFLPHEALGKSGNSDLGRILKGILNPFSYFYKSLLNPPYALNLNNFNKRKFQQLPMPAAHGFGNARSLATIYNEFATGGNILNIHPATLSELEKAPTHPKKGKLDIVLNVDIPFSLGFAKPSPFQDFGVNQRAYGTFGAGGSGAFADPEKQVAYAYVMNKMGTHIANDPRELALRQMVYECVIDLERKNKFNAQASASSVTG
jgi:CubicO group peptidase (beta-lactamase class C family)